MYEAVGHLLAAAQSFCFVLGGGGQACVNVLVPPGVSVVSPWRLHGVALSFLVVHSG